MLVSDLVAVLERLAPPALAADWDNVGLLVGDRSHPVKRVMTCLTITPCSAAEAIAERADLIVTHHPLPFHPLKRITTDTPEGRLLWELIGAGISIYSPHTAFDSASDGINQRLAAMLGLNDIRPLLPAAGGMDVSIGAGRYGHLAAAESLAEVAERTKAALKLPLVQVVGRLDGAVDTIGVACGSAGEFLQIAHAAGCQVLVTGETRFHTSLEAEATGIALILVGHYASERFGVERLAAALKTELPTLTCWPSQHERDPLAWI